MAKENSGKNILNAKRDSNLANIKLFLRGNTLVSRTRSTWLYSLNVKTSVSYYSNYSLSVLGCIDFNNFEFNNNKLKVSFEYKSFLQNFYFSKRDLERKYNFEINFLPEININYQNNNKSAHYLRNRPYNFFFKNDVFTQQPVVLKKNKGFYNFSNSNEQLMRFYRDSEISKKELISPQRFIKERNARNINKVYGLKKKKNKISVKLKQAIIRVREAILHRLAKKKLAFFWKLVDLKKKCFYKGKVKRSSRSRRRKKWVVKKGLFYKKKRKGFRKLFYFKNKKNYRLRSFNKIFNSKMIKSPTGILKNYRRRYFKKKVIKFARRKVTYNRL